MSLGWVAPVVLLGLCVLSVLWTFATAPGFKVRGKHVLLSGGTKGLGLAIAKKYAHAGAKLSLVGRSLERLESAKAEIRRATAQETSIFVVECDIGDADAVERAIADANAFHGRATHHVVHAAVVQKRGFVWEQDPAQLQRDMATTYHGAVHLFRYALPAMIEGDVRGRFVIVSSAGALATSAGSSSFSGSLSALRGLADSLRNELILYGISMSIYFPGKVHSNPYNVASKQPSPALTAAIDAAPQTYDADAKSLVDGLTAGYYSITNSWSGHLTRMLSNGVAPRKNSAVEWICIFFVAGYHVLESFVHSDQRVKSANRTQPSVTAGGAAV